MSVRETSLWFSDHADGWHLGHFHDGERLLILSGVLSVAFGALMILNPGAGALAVLWLLGAFSVAYGALLVVFAFKLKKHARTATPAVA